MLTITTSQLAAVFARQFEAKTRPGARRRKDGTASRLENIAAPRFIDVSPALIFCFFRVFMNNDLVGRSHGSLGRDI